MAAISASRMSARTPGSNRASGNGCSHGISNAGVSGAPGSSLGAPSPDGSGRRARPASAVRHALAAIRYSQVRTDARVWSYRSRAFQARSIVSCTRSSAS